MSKVCYGTFAGIILFSWLNCGGFILPELVFGLSLGAMRIDPLRLDQRIKFDGLGLIYMRSACERLVHLCPIDL